MQNLTDCFGCPQFEISMDKLLIKLSCPVVISNITISQGPSLRSWALNKM